jgi:GNAT superfamily N-acetyltransferase
MRVPLRPAEGPGDIALARALFEEYAAWLAVDLCFQSFAEELATLPGHYAPPLGRLYLAGAPGDALGCAALRPLPTPGRADRPVPEAGEVKRLYVQPRGRGSGTGRRLAIAIVDAARTIGYRRLCLDTLERMAEARSLYESLGFRQRDAYYDNPLADAVYYELELARP